MQVQKTGVVNIPGKDEVQIGGHAVMAVGYDQQARCFLVRNSWGKK
jgi:C1A family cysteine protease